MLLIKKECTVNEFRYLLHQYNMHFITTQCISLNAVIYNVLVLFIFWSICLFFSILFPEKKCHFRPLRLFQTEIYHCCPFFVHFTAVGGQEKTCLLPGDSTFSTLGQIWFFRFFWVTNNMYTYRRVEGSSYYFM